jgi:tellurite resistance protein
VRSFSLLLATATGGTFFGVGMLSRLAIESMLLHRLHTVGELPPPLRPTLGIQLAPSAAAPI